DLRRVVQGRHPRDHQRRKLRMMDSACLELQQASDGPVGPLSVRFFAGLSLVVGDSRALLAQVSELLSGARVPAHGRALLDNVPLEGHPHNRRRLYAMLADEVCLDASNVREAWRAQNRLRRRDDDALPALAQLGLTRLAEVRPDLLDPNERRAVALAYAVSAPNADVYVLHDPLGLAQLIPHDHIAALCQSLAERAVVVVVTPLLKDAVRLGGNVVMLHGGRVASLRDAAAPFAKLLLRSPDAARLAEYLRSDARFTLDFRAKRSERHVLLSGSSLTEMSNALSRAIVEHGIAIDSVELVAPSAQRLLAGSNLIAKTFPDHAPQRVGREEPR
ncbi:MAG TPA: hypothetical protein VMF89_01935, partial [Polyangiales bacterium]|nr:hypothetical protein [Polyangiales bacterium]